MNHNIHVRWKCNLSKNFWTLIQQVKVGAKICRTYSLTCPTSFVLHKRFNENENHLQLPSRFFVIQKSPRATVELSSPWEATQLCNLSRGRGEHSRESIPGVCCSHHLLLVVHEPSGAVAIWYCRCQGRHSSSQRLEGLHRSSPLLWNTGKEPTAPGHLG